MKNIFLKFSAPGIEVDSEIRLEALDELMALLEKYRPAESKEQLDPTPVATRKFLQASFLNGE